MVNQKALNRQLPVSVWAVAGIVLLVGLVFFSVAALIIALSVVIHL